jgi:ERCC4-related helicase
MDWFGEQDIAIDNFHDGTNRLLIATNVLQEGLDVPICNKIVLFDRTWTLTEFVQSRGRARNINSQLVVIGDRGEKEFYNRLVETEKVLNRVIQTLTCRICANQRAIVDLISNIENTKPRDAVYEKVARKRLKNFKFAFEVWFISLIF